MSRRVSLGSFRQGTHLPNFCFCAETPQKCFAQAKIFLRKDRYASEATTFSDLDPKAASKDKGGIYVYGDEGTFDSTWWLILKALKKPKSA